MRSFGAINVKKFKKILFGGLDGAAIGCYRLLPRWIFPGIRGLCIKSERSGLPELWITRLFDGLQAALSEPAGRDCFFHAPVQSRNPAQSRHPALLGGWRKEE